MNNHVCKCAECGSTFQFHWNPLPINNACAAVPNAWGHVFQINNNAQAFPMVSVPVANVAAGCNPNTFFTLKVGG